MESVSGGPIYSVRLFHSGPNTPQGPFTTDDDLWRDMTATLVRFPTKPSSIYASDYPPAVPIPSLTRSWLFATSWSTKTILRASSIGRALGSFRYGENTVHCASHSTRKTRSERFCCAID